LQDHPGYLSALVAKGRCHLELADGESARVVLERVVKQDATQMVANKLLVRAYLETGDPVKARERLDLYSLLNDGDPEIEDLRRRIRQIERPAQPERPSMDADPFSLEPLDLPAPAHRGGDDIFELPPAVPHRPAAAPVLEASPAPAPVALAEPEEETEEEGLPFPGLASRDRRRRYLDALGAEGLFAFEAWTAPVAEPAAKSVPQPASPVPVVEAPLAPPPPVSLIAEPFSPGPGPAELFAPEPVAPPPEEAAWLDEATAAEPPSAPPAAPEPLMPAIFAPEPPAPVFAETTTAEELWSEEETVPFDLAPPPPEAEPEPPQPVFEAEPEPAAEPRAEVATATLGALYFRQGHYTEAERIFREVLEREPDSAAARAGLDGLAALGPQPETPRLDARRLLAGYRRDPGRPAAAESRTRKIFLLSRYLERLRQGSPSDVS
ncbi:MAG TPA: tetratricopeptide repeat protein, partial [Thermoanaerobaculia bacterium]|nr:tetratricopeptide repeat protein [Thermoanaerobaculia bacterium]